MNERIYIDGGMDEWMLILANRVPSHLHTLDLLSPQFPFFRLSFLVKNEVKFRVVVFR